MTSRNIGPLLAALAAAFATPMASAQANAAAIPLCPGLQIVTAISQQEGDYESIKTIQSVTNDAVRLKFSAERPESDPLAPDFGVVKLHLIYRTILKKDLAGANFYAQKYFDKMPETIPESTGIGFSSSVLKALKSGATAEFSISNAYDATPGIDRNVAPNIYDFRAIGELKKVAAGPVKVLVNNVVTELPTITARGEFFGEASEFVILDDPNNPLTLSFRVGIGTIMAPPKPPQDADTLKVTSIQFRCPVPAPVAAAPAKPAAGPPVAAAAPAPAPSGLAADLAKNAKVAIYDIFFDFNSDKLREESEPRLKEIADVMKANPDWRLSVAGHTDSIASDAFNLDLSKRRAAAVKAALVSRYGIAANRLDTTGYGESQPRDTNATLEGRAHNRRVELQKL